MEASGSKDDHIQAGCSPEAKSRQTVRRDGFLGTASVYIVGLWSEPNYERITADTSLHRGPD